MTGIELITKERQEQIENHGFTVESDVKKYPNGSMHLQWAAEGAMKGNVGTFPYNWPDDLCNKIADKPRIERLAIAGALIAAEIDRLQAIESTNIQ